MNEPVTQRSSEGVPRSKPVDDLDEVRGHFHGTGTRLGENPLGALLDDGEFDSSFE